jgi:hypothetical protein
MMVRYRIALHLQFLKHEWKLQHCLNFSVFENSILSGKRSSI